MAIERKIFETANNKTFMNVLFGVPFGFEVAVVHKDLYIVDINFAVSIDVSEHIIFS